MIMFQRLAFLVCALMTFLAIQANAQQNDDDKYWIKTICNHEFHFDCVKEWKVVSETCPICRSGIGIWN